MSSELPLIHKYYSLLAEYAAKGRACDIFDNAPRKKCVFMINKLLKRYFQYNYRKVYDVLTVDYLEQHSPTHFTVHCRTIKFDIFTKQPKTDFTQHKLRDDMVLAKINLCTEKQKSKLDVLLEKVEKLTVSKQRLFYHSVVLQLSNAYKINRTVFYPKGSLQKWKAEFKRVYDLAFSLYGLAVFDHITEPPDK